jgi:hypothetical protein
MRTRLARLLQALLALVLLLVIVLAVPLVGIALSCDPFGEVATEQTTALLTQAGLIDAVRPEDQTYLTLPEWYIVYNADEYAAFLQQHPPSQFPYFRAIGQYWQTYHAMCQVTRGRYPFNTGYHLTLYVIGVSFTVENTLRGLYEKSVGRAAEWLSAGAPSAEERLARQVAQEYGDFIHTIPWFEFPFTEHLNRLWAIAPPHGQPSAGALVRKWERQLALTLEYGGKALYARLLKGGTQAVYAPERLEILAVVEGATPEILVEQPDIQLVQTVEDRQTILSLPRYEAFTQLVPSLVEQGVRFVEIAGNDTILLTAFAPQGWVYDLSAGALIFAQPLLTEPGQQRIAIQTPVGDLHTVLAELENRSITFEHIYDY